METVDLAGKLDLIQEHWAPKIVAKVNDHHVKLAKVKGTFTWHRHEEGDEMFLVVKGRLRLELREGEVQLGPGQLAVVPRGVEHRPTARSEAHVLLFEPRSTVNTGQKRERRTVEDEWI